MSFFRAVFSVKEETEAPKDTTTSESRRVGLAAIDLIEGALGEEVVPLVSFLLLARNDRLRRPICEMKEERNSKNARSANHEFYLSLFASRLARFYTFPFF